MFGGFLRTVLDNNRPFNKVVFSVVKDEEVLNDAIAAVEDILGDMSKPGVGLMFVMPVDRVVAGQNKYVKKEALTRCGSFLCAKNYFPKFTSNSSSMLS